MKHSHLSIGIVLGVIISLIGCSFQGTATLYPYHVDTPNASFGIADWGGGSRYFSQGANNISDGKTVLMYAPVNEAWIATGGNYTINPWTYPALPDMPNNASILYVWIVAVYKHMTNATSFFHLQYTTDATYEEVWDLEATWHNPAPGNGTTEYYVPYWKTTARNVTDSSVGGPVGGWTPAMLKSNLTWVRMLVQMHTYEPDAFLVDYIGLKYQWQYEPFAGWDDEETEDVFSAIGIGPIQILGGIGFIGMIAAPCAAILAVRQGGGGKAYYGIMALAAFTFCFGLFYASINGG